LDGDYYKSTTFSTFIITFATTIEDTRRFTCYWTGDKGSGTITFF
jgi:hypothetical protein